MKGWAHVHQRPRVGRNPFGKNTGKWLEAQLQVTHNAYMEMGIAKIHKVEPPICYTGKGIVALRNPFVDFIGSTRGRMVCMEAKSTDKDRLDLLSDGGVTKRQWDALVEWERNQAMCCVIWGYKGELRFLAMQSMKDRLADDFHSIKWDMAEAIAQGVGYILNDWLLNLRDAYGYPKAEKIILPQA